MKTQTKHCTKCDQDKELTEFNKNKSSKDGLQHYCKACSKAYREANREKILAKKKAYREANREVILAKKKAYREANREKISAYNREHKRNRLINDPVYRQIHHTRRNLSKILHGMGSHQPTLDLLGCTGPEWRDHLESQWTEGMSWDNYGHGKGKWEIDHVTPVSSFDQTDPEQRKECWHYGNTQPLWFEDNMAKGTTIPTE